MALIEFKAEIDDSEVQERLAALVARMSDPTPFLEAVGEHLVSEAGERFKGEEDPEGRPWAPLRQVTISRREKKGQLPLTILRTGKVAEGLAGSINFELAGNDSVRVGSPLEYAAVHQFGAAKGSLGDYSWVTKAGKTVKGSAPWGDIPARPFLGISQDDGLEILRLAETWLGE